MKTETCYSRILESFELLLNARRRYLEKSRDPNVLPEMQAVYREQAKGLDFAYELFYAALHGGHNWQGFKQNFGTGDTHGSK